MKKIIILGGGGFAGEVLDTIEYINKNTEEKILPLGYIYDGAAKDKGKLIYDLPVLGELSYLGNVDLGEVSMVAGIGRPVWRRKIVEETKKMGGKFISIIHPTAIINKWAKIGEGAIIQRLCNVQRDVVIGDFFCCNAFVGIGHGTLIGDYVQINPQVVVTGGAVIGSDVFLGVRATILKARIGDRSVVGACALITKDMPQNMMAKGIPAKYYEMDEKKY
ncbi:acetyltransferase (isoleucine patch superfamily) [hydrocarbon metagenome]|uniref:Acetyltransferase (Isoleucine patch superfamily) n=1 Tax=hydrocarbon metagenome TaxID=938273 RepID=A0A0W8FSX8_9ZZZZ